MKLHNTSGNPLLTKVRVLELTNKYVPSFLFHSTGYGEKSIISTHNYLKFHPTASNDFITMTLSKHDKITVQLLVCYTMWPMQSG